MAILGRHRPATDDGPGVPRNVARMSADHLSSLSLVVASHDGRPNLPDVDIHVDGRPAFFDVAPGWKGFDPDHMLGADSPLLPVPGGRWVALNRCTCGEPGCGTIAAWVEPSGDGTRVTWSNFRDFVGVFHHPLVDEITKAEVAHSKPWGLPPMHFDRASYVTEVERANADRTWETPARRTARLLRERLAPTEPADAADELAERLASVRRERWVAEFGFTP